MRNIVSMNMWTRQQTLYAEILHMNLSSTTGELSKEILELDNLQPSYLWVWSDLPIIRMYQIFVLMGRIWQGWIPLNI